jgi:hypothetical protein
MAEEVLSPKRTPATPSPASMTGDPEALDVPVVEDECERGALATLVADEHPASADPRANAAASAATRFTEQ